MAKIAFVALLLALATACSSPGPQGDGPSRASGLPTTPPAAQGNPAPASGGVRPGSYDGVIAGIQADVAKALKEFVDTAQPTAQVGDAATRAKTSGATPALMTAMMVARLKLSLTEQAKDATREAVALHECMLPAVVALSEAGDVMERAAAFGDADGWQKGFRQFDDGRRQFEGCGRQGR